MHALTSVCGKRPAAAGPGTFFDLSPRIVLLLDGLASFGTISGNLQNCVNKNEGYLAKQVPKKGKKETHMTVRLALVARLHGGLRAVHVFRDRVRRCQAVTDATQNTTGISSRLLPIGSYDRTYRAM